MDFIITCSIRWYRHYKSNLLQLPDVNAISKVYDDENEKELEYPYHTMILNLAYEKRQLKKIQILIDLIFQSVKKDFYHGDKILFNKKFNDQIAKSKSLNKEVPGFDELKHFIDLSFKITEQNIQDEYIYLLYSGKDGDDLDYDSSFNKVKKAAIIIGGHSLSRGLTVENLSISFVRSQVKSLVTQIYKCVGGLVIRERTLT